MSDKIYAELPKKRRAFICTKCGSSRCQAGAEDMQHPPCGECNYLGFGADLAYSDDEMRAFADQTHTLRLAADASQEAQQGAEPSKHDSAGAMAAAWFGTPGAKAAIDRVFPAAPTDELISLKGRYGVLVGLLRECLDPLEVSAALIESDDTEQIEGLIDKVRAALQAHPAAPASEPQPGGAAHDPLPNHPYPASASRDVGEWQAINDADLSKAEAFLMEDHGNAAFFPKDAHTLANIAMHCIREVRASRADHPRKMRLTEEQRQQLIDGSGLRESLELMALISAVEAAVLGLVEEPSQGGASLKEWTPSDCGICRGDRDLCDVHDCNAAHTTPSQAGAD